MGDKKRWLYAHAEGRLFLHTAIKIEHLAVQMAP